MQVELLVAAGVLLGAAVQRVTGLGFGLLSGPLLVLALGPVVGVSLANAVALVANLGLLGLTWRHVDLRRTVLLVVPALLTVPLGAWVVRALSPPALSVVVGTTALVALTAVLVSRRARILQGRSGTVVAGVASGLMNSTAAVGGPAVTVYAVSTGWRGPSFVGSIQLYFAAINGAALLAKGLPQLDVTTWGVAAAALVLGSTAGHLLARRVSFEQAFPVVVGLALLASSVTVLQGVLQLLA